ncbi:RNA polymerase sigma factor SigM [Gordonia sinesedis]
MPGATDTRSDTDLLRAHVAGDDEAFTTLVIRHQPYLWAVALRTSANPDDAADALQDALINAHRMAHTFRAESLVRSWLHRIVVNACLDRIRRNKDRHVLPLLNVESPALIDDTDPIGAVDLSVSIGNALHQLPPGQRAAVVAIDIEGYSIADAAELLGVPEGTIKSRTSRGRLRLAEILGHLNGE